MRIGCSFKVEDGRTVEFLSTGNTQRGARKKRQRQRNSITGISVSYSEIANGASLIVPYTTLTPYLAMDAD